MVEHYMSARQAARAAYGTISGEAMPLPRFMHALEGKGLSLRRGELTVIAARPGGMKSTLATALVAEMGVPVLYFSADSSPATTLSRLIGYHYGMTRGEIERLDADEIADMIGSSPIDFDFDPAPSLETLALSVQHYLDVHGRLPSIVVVDNLMDVDSDTGDEENNAYKVVLRGLKALARSADLHVIALHHMREIDRQEPGTPAPRTQLTGRVAQTPENVLSIAYDNSQINLAMVKVRGGEPSPMASEVFHLRVNPATGKVVAPGDQIIYRPPVAVPDAPRGFDAWPQEDQHAWAEATTGRLAEAVQMMEALAPDLTARILHTRTALGTKPVRAPEAPPAAPEPPPEVDRAQYHRDRWATYSDAERDAAMVEMGLPIPWREPLRGEDDGLVDIADYGDDYDEPEPDPPAEPDLVGRPARQGIAGVVCSWDGCGQPGRKFLNVDRCDEHSPRALRQAGDSGTVAPETTGDPPWD